MGAKQTRELEKQVEDIYKEFSSKAKKCPSQREFQELTKQMITKIASVVFPGM
jgi:GTP1/Obg family GTP-binding protein